jgi:hypothetical protein
LKGIGTKSFFERRRKIVMVRFLVSPTRLIFCV